MYSSCLSLLLFGRGVTVGTTTPVVASFAVEVEVETGGTELTEVETGVGAAVPTDSKVGTVG